MKGRDKIFVFYVNMIVEHSKEASKTKCHGQ